MAIIKCPECQKEVSDSAVSCPFCGYGVEAHIKKEQEEKQAYEEFVNSHKPIAFTENDEKLNEKGIILKFPAFFARTNTALVLKEPLL